MLGQPASSQTVCSPSRRTRDFSSVNSGPIRARVLIHGGLRSIGTALLRASTRSSRRPSGETSVDKVALQHREQVAFDDGQHGGHGDVVPQLARQ